MPEREEIEINLKTTADTSGAKQTSDELSKIVQAQEQLKQGAARPVVTAGAAPPPPPTAPPTAAGAGEPGSPTRQGPVVSPAMAALQSGATRANIAAIREEEEAKRKIELEYARNIAADRLRIARDEAAETTRAYQARLQQQRAYEQAFALARRERRVTPFGPQGPEGPELQAAQQAQVPEALRAQIEAQDKELDRTYGPAMRRTARARERIRIEAQKQAAKEARDEEIQNQKDQQKAYNDRIQELGLGEDQPPRGGGAGGAGGGGQDGSIFGRPGGLSDSSIVRATAALLGFGLGINIIAGIGRTIHQAILSAVDDEQSLERATRAATAALGTQAQAAIESAKSFQSNPLTAGSTQQYLQGLTTVRPLTEQYGLLQQQTQELLTTAGKLARVQGVDLNQALNDTKGVVTGNTDALAKYGITLTNEVGLIKSVGLSYEDLVNKTGQAAASQVLLNDATAAINKQSEDAQKAIDPLAQAFDKLAKSADAAKLAIGEAVKAPATNVVGGLAFILNPGAGFPAEAPKPRLPAANQGLDRNQDVVKNFVIDQTALATAGLKAANAIDTQTNSLTRNRTEILQTINALNFIEKELGQFRQAQNALQGPDFIRPAEIIAQQGQLQAAQDIQAQRAQKAAQSITTNFRQQLVDALTQPQQIGPIDTRAAQRELDEFDRRARARTAQAQAQQAQTLASRASANAQTTLTALDLQAQQRQLYVAQQIADLRKEYLERELGIVNLQRQEADLADQQRVAARENLDLLDAQIRARQAARPAVTTQQDIQFQQQITNAQILAIRSDVRRGALDPQALGQIADLRRQARDLARQAPRADVNALEAQRPETLIQRQLDAQADTRQLILNNIERAQRALEDQLIPLQQAQRINEQINQAIQTELELRTLADTKARTAAQQDLIAAQAVENAAGAAVRAAESWAANIHNGLTDLEQAQTILRNLLVGPSTGPTQELPYNPDRHPYGNGPSGPTLPQGATLTVQNNFTGPLTVRSQEDIDAIAQRSAAMTLQALHSAAAGYTPAASSTQLAGALTP